MLRIADQWPRAQNMYHFQLTWFMHYQIATALFHAERVLHIEDSPEPLSSAHRKINTSSPNDAKSKVSKTYPFIPPHIKFTFLPTLLNLLSLFHYFLFPLSVPFVQSHSPFTNRSICPTLVASILLCLKHYCHYIISTSLQLVNCSPLLLFSSLSIHILSTLLYPTHIITHTNIIVIHIAPRHFNF